MPLPGFWKEWKFNLFASHHKGHRFKSPGGYLCETGMLLLAMSHYIGDPDVVDHQQGLPPQLSLGPRADNVTPQREGKVS